ncbi:MAG: hypothetical protein R6V85_16525 [Polyangia bacterium]
MGVNRLFWPQESLDELVAEEKASIEDDVLSMAGDKLRYRLAPAVYFVSDVGDGEDPHDLVGRVKETPSLEEMGAEHYMDSVLLEDTAYEVAPGFVGEPLVEIRSQPRGDDISGAVVAGAGDVGENEDRELLARFLLNNL